MHLHLGLLEPRYASINGHIVAALQNNFFVLLPTLNQCTSQRHRDSVHHSVFQSNTDGYGARGYSIFTCLTLVTVFMSCRTTTLLWLNLHIYKEFTIQCVFFLCRNLTSCYGRVKKKQTRLRKELMD